MLTAMNADMCSKCFVTDPCVKSFISLALVVAAAAGCGNGREIRVQESTLKFFARSTSYQITRENQRAEPARHGRRRFRGNYFPATTDVFFVLSSTLTLNCLPTPPMPLASTDFE